MPGPLIKEGNRNASVLFLQDKLAFDTRPSGSVLFHPRKKSHLTHSWTQMGLVLPSMKTLKKKSDTPPCSNGYVIVENFQLGFGFSKVKLKLKN